MNNLGFGIRLRSQIAGLGLSIPDITTLNGYIAHYTSAGFVDDGTGNAERWDAANSSGLNLTQTNAADRVAISGDTLDWGLTGLNSQRYVTPTWPSIPKTIAVVYQMTNGATVWPEFHDWVGGNGLSVAERANRICTDDGTNTFFTEQSGAATLYRNTVQTSEFLPTPERIVVFFTNPAGIPFKAFGNNEVSNRNLVGETPALFVFSEVLTEAEMQTVVDISVRDHGVVLGAIDTPLADRVDAISSYASVYDLVNDTSLYTKGTATDRYNMASTAKTTGAILVYDKMTDPNDTTNWGTLVTGASNMSGIGAAGGTRYLQVGQQYPLGDLLRISMIASSNTAATMIGVWLQENEPESYPTLAANFYDSIGMLGTEGSNPSGAESDLNSNFTTREDALILAQHIEAGANYNTAPAGGVSLVDLMGTGSYVCPTVNGIDLTVTHSTDLVTRYPGLSIKGGSLSGTACAVGIYENGTGGKIAIVVGDGPDSDTRWEDVEWAILKYGG